MQIGRRSDIGQDLRKLFASEDAQRDEEALGAAVAVARTLKDACDEYYQPHLVIRWFDEFLEDVQGRSSDDTGAPVATRDDLKDTTVALAE